MASNFLDNLKNAVENGEFNSETAKKINEIHNVAEKKLKDANGDISKIENDLKEKAKSLSGETKILNKEEIEKAQIEYNARMKVLADEEKRNAIIASLIDENDHIIDHVIDLYSLIHKTERYYDEKNEKNKELFEKMKEFKEKYKSIVNYNDLITQ